MGIDHCGAHVLMAQQLLDRSDVLPTLQQVGGKGVPKRMAAGGLGHSGLSHRPLHRLLHHARIDMVPALGACFPVVPTGLLREDPLPGPFPLRVGVLAGQGIGHDHPPPACRQIVLMQAAHLEQLLLQIGDQALGQQRPSILAAATARRRPPCDGRRGATPVPPGNGGSGLVDRVGPSWAGRFATPGLFPDLTLRRTCADTTFQLP